MATTFVGSRADSPTLTETSVHGSLLDIDSRCYPHHLKTGLYATDRPNLGLSANRFTKVFNYLTYAPSSVCRSSASAESVPNSGCTVAGRSLPNRAVTEPARLLQYVARLIVDQHAPTANKESETALLHRHRAGPLFTGFL